MRIVHGVVPARDRPNGSRGQWGWRYVQRRPVSVPWAGMDAVRPVALVQVPPLIGSGEAATARYDRPACKREGHCKITRTIIRMKQCEMLIIINNSIAKALQNISMEDILMHARSSTQRSEIREKFTRAKAARTRHRVHRCQWKYLHGRSIISWEYPFPYRACRVTQVAATPLAVVVAAAAAQHP